MLRKDAIVSNCWDKACAESFFKTLKRELETADGKLSAKVFAGFIALIMLSHIRSVMLKKDLYKNMTKLELIRRMEKFRVQQYIKRDHILSPISRIQKTILDAFGVKYPL
jgi:hypothetical protein